jgi:hypothetical protein
MFSPNQQERAPQLSNGAGHQVNRTPNEVLWRRAALAHSGARHGSDVVAVGVAQADHFQDGLDKVQEVHARDDADRAVEQILVGERFNCASCE